MSLRRARRIRPSRSIIAKAPMRKRHLSVRAPLVAPLPTAARAPFCALGEGRPLVATLSCVCGCFRLAALASTQGSFLPRIMLLCEAQVAGKTTPHAYNCLVVSRSRRESKDAYLRITCCECTNVESQASRLLRTDRPSGVWPLARLGDARPCARVRRITHPFRAPTTSPSPNHGKVEL